MSTKTAPSSTLMVITSRAGLVHRADCPNTARRRRHRVTDLQAVAYRLPPCPDCWRDTRDYEAAIGLPARYAIPTQTPGGGSRPPLTAAGTNTEETDV